MLSYSHLTESERLTGNIKPDAGFVICVEKGSLEYKALCLIITLRKNWGRWADLPIYAYSPRAGCEASPWLLEVYNEYGVTPVLENLNTSYRDYPLANKPIVMAHAEQNTDHELLIFLDSDILCWKPPELFDLPVDKSIAMTVDTTKSVATSGVGDPNDAMWMELYEVFSSQPDIFITTSLDHQVVRGWWGSGVIATRRSAGLMTEWLEGFNRAMTSVDFLPSAGYLREQMTVSALVSAHYASFIELPVGYNYQVQNHGHYRAHGTGPEMAMLWHYQPYFNRVFDEFGRQIDRRSQLAARVECATEFVARLAIDYASMIGLQESRVAVLRKRLNVGNRVRSILGKK